VSATTPAPKRRPVADGVFLCAARTSRTAQSSLAGATEPHGFSIFGTPPALSTLAVHQLLNVRLAQSAPALSVKGTAKSTMRFRGLSNASENEISGQNDQIFSIPQWAAKCQFFTAEIYATGVASGVDSGEAVPRKIVFCEGE
jgi:hypothetical protein